MKYIVWTRAQADRQEDMQWLRTQLSSVLFVPTIKRSPLLSEVQRFHHDIHDHYHHRPTNSASQTTDAPHPASPYILFTSPTAAKIFIQHVSPQQLTPQCLFFGPTTRSLLQKAGFSLHDPERPLYSAAELTAYWAQKLATTTDPSARPLSSTNITVWYLRAKHVAHPVASLFAKHHIAVKEYHVYENLPTPLSDLCPHTLQRLRQLPHEHIITVFASPSAFLNYTKHQLPYGSTQIVIGKSTAQCLHDHGLHPHRADSLTGRSLAEKALSLL